MDNKFGIKETQEVIDFVFDLTDAIVASVKDDGKITIGDAPRFIKSLMSSPTALSGINQVPKELADLSDEELKQICDQIRARFDIADDRLEVLIENALFSAMQLTVNISRIYALKNKAA